MHAAIKCIEDTLLIRRLQARDLGRAGENAGERAANQGRLAALHEDIDSLERGLSALKAREADASLPTEAPGAKAGHQPPDVSPENQSLAIANHQSKIENS